MDRDPFLGQPCAHRHLAGLFACMKKVLIKVDKWYPSSQLCHCCGTQNPELKDLSIRKWICPSCGSEHDRDTNAAINIREEGIRLYLSGVSA